MEDLEREISSSVEEFRRGLEQAFPATLRGGPLRYAAAMDDATMEIELTPGPDRAIALLRLPTLRARIRFTAGSAAACRRMLEHLDRVTHRGGG